MEGADIYEVPKIGRKFGTVIVKHNGRHLAAILYSLGSM